VPYPLCNFNLLLLRDSLDLLMFFLVEYPNVKNILEGMSDFIKSFQHVLADIYTIFYGLAIDILHPVFRRFVWRYGC
jgi:hypothetical protein